MYIAFLIILLDMIGFGIMIPIMPFYALQLGAGEALATFCMGLYVVGMFLSTPILGRLSDYYGRKPVLMLSMAGAVIGYVLLAYSDTVLMVALSRLFSGLMAGNIAAAQAYMTDVSSDDNRAKAMGVVGAAFGLGFIIGPALGSVLAGESFENANLWLPAMVSAGMSFLAFITIIVFLKESLSVEYRQELRAQQQVSRWRTFLAVSQDRLIMPLLIAVFIYNIAAGFAESIFPIWAEATQVVAGPNQLMPLLLVAGIAMVIMQGGAIGPLVRRFGEYRLLFAGALIFGVSMFGMSLAGGAVSYYGAMASLVGQSIGAALLLTPLQSLVSKCTSHTNRGAVMGVYSSMGTLGRSCGTVLTGLAFANIHPHSSYYIAALCMLLLLLLMLRRPKAAVASS